MTYAQGALIEPLSVAAGAVSRASPKLGQPVLVCGAGPIGLAAALCARAAGAHPICITDLEESRLEQAQQLGFKLTLKVEMAWDHIETSKRIRDLLGVDCVPEIAFECTGAQNSIASAIYVRGLPLNNVVFPTCSRTGRRRRRDCSASRLWEARDRTSDHGHVFP